MSLQFLSCFLLFLCFSGVLTTKTDQDLVTTTLYYESLCPFFIEFVTEQLYPGYVKLGKNVLTVDLVPYGKANHTKIDGKWSFKCQHGPEECFGNKIQACALAQTVDIDHKFAFINCMMESSDPATIDNAEECASNNNLTWSELRDCIEGPEGDDLLAQYGERTKAAKPKLSHVPYIFFNGVYDRKLEIAARRDFFATACDLYKVKPDVCNKLE